jgi:membrane protein YdbS with pleckstrin-like domain
MSKLIHFRDIAIAFLLIVVMQVGLWWQDFVKNQNWELITIVVVMLSGPVCLVLWLLRIVFEKFK